MTVRPTLNVISINDFSDKVNFAYVISMFFFFFSFTTLSEMAFTRISVHRLYLNQFYVMNIVYALGRSDVLLNFLNNTASHFPVVPYRHLLRSKTTRCFKVLWDGFSISTFAIILTFDPFHKSCCISPCIKACNYDNVSRTSTIHFTTCATVVVNYFTYNNKVGIIIIIDTTIIKH